MDDKSGVVGEEVKVKPGDEDCSYDPQDTASSTDLRRTRPHLPTNDQAVQDNGFRFQPVGERAADEGRNPLTGHGL